MVSETMSSAETIELYRKYVIPNYGRFGVSLQRGEGSYVRNARRPQSIFGIWPRCAPPEARSKSPFPTSVDNTERIFASALTCGGGA